MSDTKRNVPYFGTKKDELVAYLEANKVQHDPADTVATLTQVYQEWWDKSRSSNDAEMIKEFKALAPTFSGDRPFATYETVLRAELDRFTPPVLDGSDLYFRLLRAKLTGDAFAVYSEHTPTTAAALVQLLHERFPTEDQAALVEQLKQLTYSNSVDAYASEFKTIVNRIEDELPASFQASMFLAGFPMSMRSKIRDRDTAGLRLLSKAISLAREVERESRESVTSSVLTAASNTRPRQRLWKPPCPVGSECKDKTCDKYHRPPNTRVCKWGAACRKHKEGKCTFAHPEGSATMAISYAATTMMSDSASASADAKELQFITVSIGSQVVRALKDSGSDWNHLSYELATVLKLKLQHSPHTFNVFNGTTSISEVTYVRVGGVETKFGVAKRILPGIHMLLSRSTYERLEQHVQQSNTLVSGEYIQYTPQVELYMAKLKSLASDTAQGPIKHVDKIVISTREHDPVVVRQRSFKAAIMEELTQWAQKAMTEGLIEKSESPYRTNLNPVRKDNGELRVTQNLAPLSPFIIGDAFPLPEVDDILACVKKGRIFSEIDIKSAYLQCALAEASREMTAFAVGDELYQWRVLAQGLKVGPAKFDRVMTQVFKEIPVFRFFDNILVITENVEQHCVVLDQVIERMRHHNVTPNVDKAKLFKHRIDFLVFELSANHFQMRSDLLDKVRQAERPTDRKSLQSFLGLANILRRYHPDLANTLSVLHQLTTVPSAEWEWTAIHEDAFQRVRSRLAVPMPLKYFDLNAPYEIYTDASGDCISGVILQGGHPVLFDSHALGATELKWPIQEKELYALVYILKKHRRMLMSNKLDVHIDNRNVTYLKASQKPKVVRWYSLLEEFDMTISFVKGVNNPADVFTRYVPPLSTSMAANAVEEDKNQKLLLPMTTWTLIEAQRADPVLQLTAQNAPLKHVRVGSLVCRKLDERTFVPLIPHTLIPRVLEYLHIGHVKAAKMQHQLSEVGYFQNSNNLIEEFVRTCEVCCKTGPQPHPPDRAMTDGLQQCVTANERWQMDYFQVSSGPNAGDYLNIVDQFSGYSMCHKTAAQSAKCTIDLLTQVFGVFGKPRIIQSDNGTHFSADEVNVFLTQCGIEQVFSTPRSAQTNGLVEKHNELMKKFLVHCNLPEALTLSNFSAKLFTTIAPAEAYFNRPIGQHTLEDIKRFALDKQEWFLKYKRAHDAKAPEEFPPVAVSDMVFVQEKSQFKRQSWHGPYRVEKVLDSHVQVRSNRSNKILKVSRRLLKIRTAIPAVDNTEVPTMDEKEAENAGQGQAQQEHKEDEAPTYLVESIIDHKKNNNGYMFRVKWKDYGSHENTWEPAANIPQGVLCNYWSKLIQK